VLTRECNIGKQEIYTELSEKFLYKRLLIKQIKRWETNTNRSGLLGVDVDETDSALLATCFHAGFLLALFFDPEDGGDMFLRNVG
jgi:hypothetical protein